jgi:ABC-type multidrug transport system fused ATPase/permease subunit
MQMKGAVAFEDASFCYRGNDTCGEHFAGDLSSAGVPTLQNLNFQVNRGRRLPLWGRRDRENLPSPNSSTVFYDVDSGRVLVGWRGCA